MEEETGTEQATPAAEEKKTPLTVIDAIVLSLAGKEDAPSKEEIEAWKKQYRNIHMFALNEDEIFIYRTIGRSEYRTVVNLQDTIKAANQKATPEEVEDKARMEVCKMAVLYPKDLDSAMEYIGGLSFILSDQIYFSSCIVPAQVALGSIRKI